MAKNSVGDWDATAGNNTDVGGINIDEGMSTGDVNNAIREVMAQIKTYSIGVIPPGVTASYAGSTPPSGWLLLNGDTLGSAASTATQGSDDYQNLYELIWNSMADTEAPVTGGRGASATADFTANKNITMPNAKGRVLAGLETSASRLTTGVSGIDGGLLGDSGGDQRTQDHLHKQQGEADGNFGGGGSARNIDGTSDQNNTGLASDAGDANAAKMGGDSGNVQPTLILSTIIKY